MDIPTVQPSAPEGAPQHTPPTPTGTPKVFGAWFSYFFGWITGLIFFFTSKDPFVRFHAAQSIVVFAILHGINIMLGGYSYGYMYRANPLMGLISLVSFVLWIVLMIKAYNGERFKLPVVGDWAEKLAHKQ
jgi:uncharacterized membrane protein